MKICYLSDASSIHTKKMCYFFKEKGYDISVISLNDGEIDGVKVYSMGMDIKNQGSFISKVGYLKYVMKMKNIVKEVNPDILHAHYASSYGLIGSFINYNKYILSVWGSDVYDFPRKSFVHKNILKYNLSKADILLSTSKAMVKETRKYTDKEIYITPFGVDVNKFKPNEIGYSNNGELIIGTIKTLEEKYGIEYLIRAFHLVKKNNGNLNVKLKIAGKGSKEKELKMLCKELSIEDCVEFLGFISQDEVVEVLNSFDIAVFPSILDSESFGVAAVEAEACGVPVIVSDVEGLMESTKPEYSSLVFRKKDTKDLVEKIERLLLDDELRINMKKNARRYVEENYNYIDNFNYINDIYLDLLINKS